MPRSEIKAFITLLRDFGEGEITNKKKQPAFNVIIETRCKLLKDEYLSIKQKLNQYSTIIDTGWEFFLKILNDITETNKKNMKLISQKSK